MPATTLVDEEAITLEKELYHPLLPKLGCNRNFPLLLRYNSPHLLGLGIKDPLFEQGVAKLLYFVTYGGTNTAEGKLITSCTEYHRLEVRLFTPLLQLDYKKYIILTTDTWLRTLWKFISEHKITVCNQAYTLPGMIREKDQFVMDILMRYHNLKDLFLRSVNRVRCYFFKDMTCGDGKSIKKECTVRGVKPVVSEWDWPTEQPLKTLEQCKY